MAGATASAHPPCVLPESVLQPFANGPAQIRYAGLRTAEKTFNRFDVCVQATGQIDEPSRVVLFKLVDAIGYWIDPENTQFSEQDKAAMTRFLLGALAPNPEYVNSDLVYRINFAALEALAHSNDPTVAVSVRKWAAAPSAEQNLLQAEALDTALAIEMRLLK